MWGMYRWASRLLIAVMLVPSMLPMAMPCAALPEGTRFSASTPSNFEVTSSGSDSAPSMMHCHHGMAGMHHGQPRGEASDSLLAGNPTITGGENCCQGHCCCGAMTSEWAQPAAGAHARIVPLIESTTIAKKIVAPLAVHFGPDSARAPPLG
jgi:hypothetical protein